MPRLGIALIQSVQYDGGDRIILCKIGDELDAFLESKFPRGKTLDFSLRIYLQSRREYRTAGFGA